MIGTKPTPLPSGNLGELFGRFSPGDTVLVRLSTGEVAIAEFQGEFGPTVQLRSPRVLKLEKMHLVYTDFMMAGDAKVPCDVLTSQIIAIARPTSEAERGYRALIARL